MFLIFKDLFIKSPKFDIIFSEYSLIDIFSHLLLLYIMPDALTFLVLQFMLLCVLSPMPSMPLSMMLSINVYMSSMLSMLLSTMLFMLFVLSLFIVVSVLLSVMFPMMLSVSISKSFIFFSLKKLTNILTGS